MKIVYLTSGPRGAGKTTYVARVKNDNPDVLLIDRDAIFLEKFGSVGFDPYSGMHITAREYLEQRIKEVVSSSNEDAKIILDAWNGRFGSRLHFIDILRDLGVDFIVCWYFVTPLAVCQRWFMKKPNRRGLGKTSCLWDYKIYHEEASDINYPDHEFYRPANVEIDDNRFNLIRRINPLQLDLPGMPLI